MRARVMVLIGLSVAVTSCHRPGSVSPSSDWVATHTESLLDGEKLMVHKDFPVGRHLGVIRVIVSCLPRAQQLSVSLESYQPDGSPSPLYEDDHHQLEGRLKFRTDSQPVPISRFFVSDKYLHIANWKVRRDAATAIPLAPGDVGGYFVTLLPMVLEVSNSNGEREIQIPAGNPTLVGIIDRCREAASAVAAPSPIAMVARSPSTSSAGVGGAAYAVRVSRSASLSSRSVLNLSSSTGPGFDCTKARSPVEHMICQSAVLSSADRALTLLYRRRRAAARADAAKLESAEQAFLARRDRCTDVTCVEHAYDQRLKELSAPSPP